MPVLRFHPGFQLLAVLGAVALCFSVASFFPAPEDSSTIDFSKSRLFRQLLACSDVSDAKQCLKKFRTGLLAEAKRNLSISAYSGLDSCLALLEHSKVDDLSLFLNILTCFHQANNLDYSKEFVANGSYTSVGVGNFICIFILIVSAFHTLAIYIFRKHELSSVDAVLQQLEQEIEASKRCYRELANAVQDAIALVNSETDNISARLNVGGDISNEIKSASTSLLTLTQQFVRFRECYFDKSGPITALLPPESLSDQNHGWFEVSGETDLPFYGAANNLPQNNEILHNEGENCAVRVSQGALSKTKQKFEMLSQSLEPQAEVRESYQMQSQFRKPHPGGGSLCARNLIHETTDLSYVLKAAPNSNTRPSFDISSSEGRIQLKAYFDQKLKLRQETPPIPVKCHNSKNSSIGRVRYKEIPKMDANNKKFKRVFVPNRGWVATRKIEKEESQYGSECCVKLGDA